MTYATTVTKKGQITIPKVFRDQLGLDQTRRVLVEMESSGKSLKLKPAPDFLEVVRKIRPPKRRINVLKAREYMERNYERV